MKKILRSQKGMTLLIISLTASTMMALLILITISYYQKMLNEVSYQRDRIYALQAMQDLAILAQKANDAFVQNIPSGGGCGSLTQIPSGKNFCWNESIATANCINDPRRVGSTICIDFATSVKVRLSLREEKNPGGWIDRVQRTASLIYENRRQIVSRTLTDLGALMSVQANAQSAPELYLPVITSPMPVTTLALNNVTCDNTSADATGICKKCEDRPPGGKNVDCLEIRVCMRDVGGGGCTNDDQWFSQTIGIIDRGS